MLNAQEKINIALLTLNSLAIQLQGRKFITLCYHFVGSMFGYVYNFFFGFLLPIHYILCIIKVHNTHIK